MKSANLSTQGVRQSDVGLTWEEKLSNAIGTIQVPQRATFRVRCVTTGTTVTIGGILAATMLANEIMIFNAGADDAAGLDAFSSSGPNPLVTVVIAAQNAYVQVARENDRK